MKWNEPTISIVAWHSATWPNFVGCGEHMLLENWTINLQKIFMFLSFLRSFFFVLSSPLVFEWYFDVFVAYSYNRVCEQILAIFWTKFSWWQKETQIRNICLANSRHTDQKIRVVECVWHTIYRKQSRYCALFGFIQNLIRPYYYLDFFSHVNWSIYHKSLIKYLISALFSINFPILTPLPLQCETMRCQQQFDVRAMDYAL